MEIFTNTIRLQNNPHGVREMGAETTDLVNKQTRHHKTDE